MNYETIIRIYLKPYHIIFS